MNEISSNGSQYTSVYNNHMKQAVLLHIVTFTASIMNFLSPKVEIGQRRSNATVRSNLLK